MYLLSVLDHVDVIVFLLHKSFIAYGAGYGTMSGAATSQYGVASTTAMAGQTPPTGAGGAGSVADYTAFGIYGDYFNLLMKCFYE